MYKITFDSHILNICLKANKKLGVLCTFFNILASKFQVFLKALLNIALLYACSVTDLPIKKSTNFSKEL